MHDAPIRAGVIPLAFSRWTSANGLCKMQSGAREGAPLLEEPRGVGRAKTDGVASRPDCFRISPQSVSRELVPMADYKIAAIPTVYRGGIYRSRLEARWAEFFDCLGFSAEYEPFQLPGWLPDFRLPGVLVEVKPHDYWSVHPRITWEKISRAAEASRRKENLLLTRYAPDRVDGFPCIGWAGGPTDSYQRRHAYVLRDGLSYKIVYGDRQLVSRLSPDWPLCHLVRTMWDSTRRGLFS